MARTTRESTSIVASSSSSAALTETVNQDGTTTTLTGVPNPDLFGQAITLTAKLVLPGFGERQLAEQLHEDVAYYQRRPECRTLVCLVFYPERLLTDRGQLEAAWSRPRDERDVLCVIA